VLDDDGISMSAGIEALIDPLLVNDGGLRL